MRGAVGRRGGGAPGSGLVAVGCLCASGDGLRGDASAAGVDAGVREERDG